MQWVYNWTKYWMRHPVEIKNHLIIEWCRFAFWFVSGKLSKAKLTSRDRPKSAPYPRLKNSKKTSKCQVFFYSTRKSKIFEEFFLKTIHTKKMDRVARRGPASASPWRANVSQGRKPERGGPFEVFQHPFCRKTWKNWRKKLFFFIFGKKSHNAKKNWKEEPFGIFQHPFCRKTSKKFRGPFEEKKFRKKNPKKMSRSAEKNWKGGLFGLARYGMLRRKTGKTILVQFARPNGAIWHHNIL